MTSISPLTPFTRFRGALPERPASEKQVAQQTAPDASPASDQAKGPEEPGDNFDLDTLSISPPNKGDDLIAAIANFFGEQEANGKRRGSVAPNGTASKA